LLVGFLIGVISTGITSSHLKGLPNWLACFFVLYIPITPVSISAKIGPYLLITTQALIGFIGLVFNVFMLVFMPGITVTGFPSKVSTGKAELFVV
jgi:hypothetical protein